MIKQYYDKTGRVHNLLLRSHEEKMTDFVYRETKMIEIQKNYLLTLTEEQARELYRLLQTEKDSGCLTPDRELKLVYHELKNIFDTGIRCKIS
jgi:hypothetical protein